MKKTLRIILIAIIIAFVLFISLFSTFRYKRNNSSADAINETYSIQLVEYSKEILTAINCDSSGKNEPTFNKKDEQTYYSWEILKNDYEALSVTDKEILLTTTSNSDGNDIEKALAIYDYIIVKYGAEHYENFIQRNIVVPPSPKNKQESFIQNYGIVIVVIVTLVSITTISIILIGRRH